jgi:formate-dependent nitrite reductase membrane component NrfD
MVWGAWFLTAHGAVSALWLVAGWLGWYGVLTALAWPTVIIAVLATAYTGFLFAQGLGRDLWQGPHAAIDLIAQSTLAGSAVLALASFALGDTRMIEERGFLFGVLFVSVCLHVVILIFENLLSPSPTNHHELAVRTIRRGAFAHLFWGLAIIGGGIVPLAGILASDVRESTAIPVLVCLLALAGSGAWEYIWVEAGQSVPLS